MKGTWTESFTNQTCPRCSASGKPDSRLYTYSVVEDGFSILQVKCHTCKAVQTIASSSSSDALAAANKAHRRARTFAVIAVGELVAMSAFALTASALAALR
jgi:phage FluMu protein Com